MFCTSANRHITTATDRSPFQLPFSQTIIIPAMGGTLLHRLLCSFDVATSHIPSSLLEEVGTCIEAIFVNSPRPNHLHPTPQSPPPLLPMLSSNAINENTEEPTAPSSSSRPDGDKNYRGHPNSAVMHEVLHRGSSVLGIVGGILVRDLPSWLVRIAGRHLHHRDMSALHSALRDIELYGRTFCSRDVGKVRARQYSCIKRRYEEERSLIEGGGRSKGSAPPPSAVCDERVPPRSNEEDEGFVLGFMELLCDALQEDCGRQPPPPSSTAATTNTTGKDDSSSTPPPTTNFGRVQRNCNTFNITSNHATRLKGRHAFSYVMSALQSPPITASSSSSSALEASSSAASAAVPKLSSVPMLLCHVFPSSSRRRRTEVDISPMGMVCLWETLLHVITSSEMFIGTLQPDLDALSMWRASSSKSSAHTSSTTTSEHRHRRSSHSLYIGGSTTWDALVGGRRYSKVEFRQGDALMLGL